MTSAVVEGPEGNTGVGGVPIESLEDPEEVDDRLLTDNWPLLCIELILS